MQNGRIIIVGGSGFVGTHLQSFFRDSKVFVADIVPPRSRDDRVSFIHWDIRSPFTAFRNLPDKIDLIVNLAAVHKSPGHPSHEYFETNILGARHVCDLAKKVQCNQIVFTSSISVYGAGEDEKTEESLTTPDIPYGVSKIVAESVHREWQVDDKQNRALTVLRPAVVFGRGEGGNFTRLATTLRKKIFVYPGRKDTIKSWIYVKDLCRIITDHRLKEPGIATFNVCFPTKTTTEDICRAFHDTLSYKMPRLTVPLFMLNTGAFFLNRINTPFIRSLGLDPDRIVKLVCSTNISPARLVEINYAFRYDLNSAILDWKNDCDGDCLC